MEKQELRTALFELHKELEHAESVDKVERELMRDLIEDIEHILAVPEGAGTQSERPHSLMQALREAGGHFEETHPSISAVIGRTADILARMGI